MHTGTVDSQLKYSSVSGCGVITDSAITSGQSNLPYSCQSQSHTNGKEDIFCVSAQDQKSKSLQDKNGSHDHHLPSYTEDSNSLHKVDDDVKYLEDANTRKISSASEKNVLTRSQSLIFTSLTEKSTGQKKPPFDDIGNSNRRNLRKHRKTEPNLTIRKRKSREIAPLFFPPSQWSARFGIQFFTVVIPKVSVVNDNVKGSRGSYAEYHLQIKRGRQVIARKYRYSQFANFHKALLSSSIMIIMRGGKIRLPPRTWFRNISENFLQQRRVELEKYLHRLLRFKYSTRERTVQKFLGLNEFVVKDFWIDH